MADNTTLNPGTGGDVIASDDIGGVKYQRVKPAWGVDGSAVDTSETSPLPVAAYGELIEALEAMRFAVQSLTRSIGQMMPDTANRMRVNVEAGTLPTVTTVGTVSTVTTMATLTNQTQIGGLAATEQIPSLMRLGADSLRRNISVT
jgi:hypothetical protein